MRSMYELQPRGLSFSVQLPPVVSADDSLVHNRTALVQSFHLFSNLSPEVIKEIVSRAHQKEFVRRQIIYQEDEPVRHIYMLTVGCAKITQVGQSGSEVILRLNGPGEVVGKVGHLDQERHCSMAQAVCPSTALLWDAAAFESLSQRFPLLRRNTMEGLSRRLEELEERFREISTERVAVRLSRQIVRLLDHVGRRVNGVLEIGLSREELAQLTGTTLFTVSRLLSDWDQRGIVSTRREAVSVNDRRALQQLAESE